MVYLSHKPTPRTGPEVLRIQAVAQILLFLGKPGPRTGAVNRASKENNEISPSKISEDDSEACQPGMLPFMVGRTLLRALNAPDRVGVVLTQRSALDFRHTC